MNDTDLHNQFKALARRTEIRLPRHQRALKQRLLVQHAHQQAGLFRFKAVFNQITGVFTHMKTKGTLLGSIGLSALIIGVIAFTTLADKPVSALELATKAADKVETMNKAEIEAKNKKYQQNLRDRLQEAKNSSSLRVIKLAELDAWGVYAERNDPEVAKYLTFNDTQNHRIVIGLNAEAKPVLVFDVEMVQAAKGTTMQVTQPSNEPGVQIQPSGPQQR